MQFRRIVVLVVLAVALGCSSAPGRPRASLTAVVADVKVEIERAPGRLDLPDEAIVEWVRQAAGAIAVYYGKFPVANARVTVEPVSGSGARNGVARNEGGPSVHVELGEHTTRPELAADWEMTHELLHLCFPDTGHSWLEEGMATYVEPIARARAGLIADTKVWSEMLDTYDQGLPGPGDRGLDHTPTWGRTYYGGAIFCLVADVEIRKKTQGRRGLEDALRAIAAEGGTIEWSWPIERVLRAGDRGAGVAVLEPLHARLKDAPGDVDLAGLFRDLGVERGRLRDDAPLASVRKAITRR